MPWQLVSAQGFTFCVPADWQTADGRTWHGAGGSITWGTGVAPRQAVASGVVVLRVPANGAMPSEAAVRAAAEAQHGTRCSPHRFTERIGGTTANLFDTECEGQYHTGVQWDDPAVYFHGETGNAGTASLQLQVYRTTRFTSVGCP